MLYLGVFTGLEPDRTETRKFQFRKAETEPIIVWLGPDQIDKTGPNPGPNRLDRWTKKYLRNVMVYELLALNKGQIGGKKIIFLHNNY